MTGPAPSIERLARELVELRRRLDAMDRSARLQFSTIGIATSDAPDAPVVDVDVSGGVWTAYEASADATSALDKATRAARTFKQPTPPTPAGQPDGIIPDGSLWTDTDAGNLQYRWEGGVWVQVPLGQSALDAQLVALITMRFQTTAERDQLIPTPAEGMRAYVVATNLNYQYAAGQWVPELQVVKKTANQSVSNSTLANDADLWIDLVPGAYRVEPFLHMSGSSTGNVKIAWTYSGTVVTGNRSSLGMAKDAATSYSTDMRTTGHALTTSVEYGTQSDDTSALREDILLRVSTPGRLRMRFAQASDGSGSVTMSAASRIYVTKVE